jgi:hypothetical protein
MYTIKFQWDRAKDRQAQSSIPTSLEEKLPLSNLSALRKLFRINTFKIIILQLLLPDSWTLSGVLKRSRFRTLFGN